MENTSFTSAWKSIHHPQKAGMVIVPGPGGSFNATTIEWYMRTSLVPAMLAISLGISRYSHTLLQQAGHFNLVIPGEKMLDAVRYCGSCSGREEDKFTHAELDFFKGKWQGLPVPKLAAAVFECVYVSQLGTGDHTIFVGEVKYSWSNAEIRPLLVADLLPE